jgi:hypothetical protein
MGLFDTIELHDSVVLPEYDADTDKTEAAWQTKDIGRPEMATYRITEDGRLERKYQETEHRGEKFEQIEDTEIMIPQIAVLDEWWGEIDHHGIIEFHTTVDFEFNETTSDGFPVRTGGMWYSYEATFTHGELESIDLVEKSDMGSE